MDRKIRQIEARLPNRAEVTRVAAYARVSSGKDAMLHSLSAQVSYYSDLIQQHPGWLFCGVYADEALTGTKDNVTWGQRKRFADGKVSMPYKHFLGYEKGPDGLPKVVPEEAKTVRYIFDLFMSGMTTFMVARQLTAEGIPTPSGKTKWAPSTVDSILRNEKYAGNALLQKRYTVDFLQKKMKVNEGEVQQYYVENSHEAIVSPELFDQVQEEMERRRKLGWRYRSQGLFSCRIVCGDCGEFYGPKVWNSTSKYRKKIWQCNAKFKGEHKCTTPHLTGDAIRAKFIEAYNQLITDRERLLEDCRLMQDHLSDCTEIDREIKTAEQETAVAAALMERSVSRNSRNALDQDAFREEYDGLVERYEKAKGRIAELEKTRTRRVQKADVIGGFMFTLMERDAPLTTFTEGLWIDSMDQAVVHSDGSMTFRFLGGSEVTVC